MSDRLYRQAFFMALTACVALAVGVGYLLHHRNHPMLSVESGDPVVARGPAAATSTQQRAVPPTADQLLGPIQISPQRLQQIGVTTGVVQLKTVNDKLSIP